MKNSVPFGTVLLLAIFSACYGDPASCGDWESSGQHCYKVIDKEVTHTHSDAVKLCQQNDGASLISIRTKEEQDFLTSFLFTRLQVVDNVWLDAQFVPSDKMYKWTQDDGKLIYTNWIEEYQNNLPNYCVEMRSEAKSLGKWSDQPCTKKNLAVCQKDQSWSVDTMQRVLKEMQEKMLKTEIQLSETRKEMAEAKAQSKNNVASIPLGFIYVQLPQEKSPSEMWSGLVWSDVSYSYAGVFFRVEGGNATELGQGVQEENAPHLTKVDYQHVNVTWEPEIVPNANSDSGKFETGKKLFSVRSGFHVAGQSAAIHGYNVERLLFWFSEGEVRPRNLAVKIWKRTG